MFQSAAILVSVYTVYRRTPTPDSKFSSYSHLEQQSSHDCRRNSQNIMCQNKPLLNKTVYNNKTADILQWIIHLHVFLYIDRSACDSELNVLLILGDIKLGLWEVVRIYPPSFTLKYKQKKVRVTG